MRRHFRPVIAKITILYCAAVAAHAAMAQTPAAATVFRVQDIVWRDAPHLPGVQIAVIFGDPGKPEPFTVRFRFPPGSREEPHAHPHDERVTILSGAWYTASGTTFDAARLDRLAAGDGYFLPAGVEQYALTREETVIQVDSVGPWGVHFPVATPPGARLRPGEPPMAPPRPGPQHTAGSFDPPPGSAPS